MVGSAVHFRIRCRGLGCLPLPLALGHDYGSTLDRSQAS